MILKAYICKFKLFTRINTCRIYISGNVMCVSRPIIDWHLVLSSAPDTRIKLTAINRKCPRLYKYSTWFSLSPTSPPLLSFLWLAIAGLAMSSVVPLIDDVRADRAGFDGTLLACLAFGESLSKPSYITKTVNWSQWLSGALLVLYIQLIQVLRGRPKRCGRVFWGIIVYSSALFPLATLAVIGNIQFAELMYVTNRLYPSGPTAYYFAHSGLWPNVMTQVRWGWSIKKLSVHCVDINLWASSTTILPWIGNILMVRQPELGKKKY